MLTEQQIEEMMARVRRLELKARRLVRESFSGEYLSSFRGRGMTKGIRRKTTRARAAAP